MYGIIDGGVHYCPKDSVVSLEASGLLRLTPTISPIIEGIVETGKDETMANLLAAIKVRLRPGVHVGAGMQFALTDYRDFDNQAPFSSVSKILCKFYFGSRFYAILQIVYTKYLARSS